MNDSGASATGLVSFAHHSREGSHDDDSEAQRANKEDREEDAMMPNSEGEVTMSNSEEDVAWHGRWMNDSGASGTRSRPPEPIPDG